MNQETLDLISTLTPILVAGLAVIGSAVVGAVSFYSSRKKQIEDETRRQNKEVYESFYDALVEMARDSNGVGVAKAFSQAYNKILFTGSDDVVKSVIAWRAKIDSQSGRGDINDPLLKEAIDFMRKDLGISKESTIMNSNFVLSGYK